MKVLVLSGSPRQRGNSNALAEAFCRGAEEAGHDVQRFDTARMKVHPCLACDACRRGGTCCQQDDMQQIAPHVVDADVIALATPLYYFGMSAQLKTVIDRFYGVNEAMRNHPKQALLLAVCGDAEDAAMDALKAHYAALCAYCHWQDKGQLLGIGLYDVGDVQKTDLLEQAYALGKGLGA